MSKLKQIFGGSVYLQLSSVFLAVIMFGTPSFALGATYTYTCGDLASASNTGITCTLDVLSITAGDHAEYTTNPLADGSTVYLSMETIGTGRLGVTFGGDVAGSGYYVQEDSSVTTSQTINLNTGNTGAVSYLKLYDVPVGTTCGGDTCNFVGDVEYICVATAFGECESGPGPDPTATSTTDTIYNPNQDFFNGLLLFIIMMFGVMFWFKQ